MAETEAGSLPKWPQILGIAQIKPETQNSIWIFHMDGWGPSFMPFCTVFTGTSAENWSKAEQLSFYSMEGSGLNCCTTMLTPIITFLHAKEMTDSSRLRYSLKMGPGARGVNLVIIFTVGTFDPTGQPVGGEKSYRWKPSEISNDLISHAYQMKSPLKKKEKKKDEDESISVFLNLCRGWESVTSRGDTELLCPSSLALCISSVFLFLGCIFLS